jgi:peptidoglycan/LPS O-acetylase OafA/YrhL
VQRESGTVVALAQAPKQFFPAVDLLRGFAAISVVVYHVIQHFDWVQFPITGPLTWFRIGWMGVDMFFVISGFVIGLAAFAGIDEHGPSGFRSGFIARRFARIIPLHYLTMLIFVVMVAPDLLLSPDLGIDVATHLLFIHNLFYQYHGAINGPNWSLGAEMQFYLLVVLIAPWLRCAPPWKLFLAMVGIAWAWRFGVLLFQPDQAHGDLFRTFAAATQMPGMLDEFAVGLLLARFMRSESGKKMLAILHTEYSAWLTLTLAAAAGVLMYVTLALFWKFATFWNYPAMVVGFRTLLAGAFGLLVLSACSIGNGRFSNFLLPLTYTGKISYGIYLWHLPVLLSLKRVQGLSPMDVLLLALPLTCLLASISWHFFELPLMQRLRPTGYAPLQHSQVTRHA